MKYPFYTILLIITLVSCKRITENTEQNVDKSIENEKNISKENINCKNRSHETFKRFKINGVLDSEFNITKFIEANRKPDSIVNGYYFYGKSNFLFYSDKLVVVEITDDKLYFDDFLSINTSLLTIEDKFPCSFENRYKTEYKNVKCEVINLYDDDYNKIKIFVSAEETLGVVYLINESNFDELN